MSEPRNVWDLHCERGEGPVWVDGALWFVDIKKQKIYRYEPSSGGRREWDAPEQIGFILPADNGSFVTGLQSGLHLFDPDSGSFTLIAEMEPERPNNRLNDGVVDPSGRLWFGTMDNGEKDKTGAFYRFQRGAIVRTGLEGISITNGIGLYAGWEARRYSPQGELLGSVRFPVANITKIAFGGDDLRTVYATTARQMLRPDQIERQPQIGDLFEFRVDVPGVACPKVALA